MPQELYVLRCYNCSTFQVCGKSKWTVNIVKKVPKWQCKLCNEKQSVLKVYARGSGKDCRSYVQELNLQQGLIKSSETAAECPDYNAPEPGPSHYTFESDLPNQSDKGSKWDDYLDREETSDDVNDYQDEGDEFPIQNQSTKSGSRHCPDQEQVWTQHTSKGNLLKGSKWDNYLDKQEGSDDVYEYRNEENEFPPTRQESGFRKRKLDHRRDEETEDIQCYNPEYQTKSTRQESLPMDPSDSFVVNPQSRKKINSLAQTCSTDVPSKLQESRSKWSQFTTKNMTADGTFSQNDCYSSMDQSRNCVSSNKVFGAHVNHVKVNRRQDFASSVKPQTARQHLMDTVSSFSGTSAGGASKFNPGARDKNPFTCTSDENLDSILDF